MITQYLFGFMLIFVTDVHIPRLTVWKQTPHFSEGEYGFLYKKAPTPWFEVEKN